MAPEPALVVKNQMIRKIKATLLKKVTDVSLKNFDNTSINRIVILRYDRIGDMIVSLPLCKALNQSMPLVHITMIASSSNASIAEGCGFIDKTVIKPTKFLHWAQLLMKLRSKKYDIAFDLNHAVTPHTIYALRILKPKHVASPFKDGRWGVKGTELKLFDLMPKEHKLKYARPIAETYLDIARLLNCSTNNCLPYPLAKYPRPHWLPSRYVVINPTGSREAMRLPDGDIKIIIEQICALDPHIGVVIPAIHRDYMRLNTLFQDSHQVNVLNELPSIQRMLPIIQFATLVVTPDTSLVHIACGYKTALIAIYTSDNALFDQWKPYQNPNASVIRSQEHRSLIGYSLSELVSLIKKKVGSTPNHIVNDCDHQMEESFRQQ